MITVKAFVIRRLVSSTLFVCCFVLTFQTGAFAWQPVADKEYPLFQADELLQGVSDEARWQKATSCLPLVLGASRDRVVEIFGESKICQRMSPRLKHAGSPSFIYGISQKMISNSIAECVQLCLYTNEEGSVFKAEFSKWKSHGVTPAAFTLSGQQVMLDNGKAHSFPSSSRDILDQVRQIRPAP